MDAAGDFNATLGSYCHQADFVLVTFRLQGLSRRYILAETPASAFRWREDQPNLAAQAVQVGVNVSHTYEATFWAPRSCHRDQQQRGGDTQLSNGQVLTHRPGHAESFTILSEAGIGWFTCTGSDHEIVSLDPSWSSAKPPALIIGGLACTRSA
jgi:hypothetical protein